MSAWSNPYNDVIYPGELGASMDIYINNDQIWNPPSWQFWKDRSYSSFGNFPIRSEILQSLYVQYYPG